MWKSYVWKRQTIANLAETFQLSSRSIRRVLHSINVQTKTIPSRPVILALDCVFFSRGDGLIVARDPINKQMICWHQIKQETRAEYRSIKDVLKAQGFEVLGVIIDGKKGVRELFYPIPVQMCHFHQKQIVTRYLTLNPKLEASKELKEIVSLLTLSTEDVFSEMLLYWHDKWSGFLKEKTTEPSGKWHYTHRRLRSAYRSLKTNLSFLFTYKNYPNLNMPNTTNSLEGSFSYLKDLLRTHRGFNSNLKLNIIAEIFSK